MRRIVPLLLLLVVVFAALLWSQDRAGPFFVSGLVEADAIRVGSRVGGRVQEVLVEEGQAVEAGTALALLEPFDLRERLARAEAESAALQAELGRLRAGFRDEEIAQARARRDRLRALLDKAEAGPRPLEIRILEQRHEIARAGEVEAQSEFERVQSLFRSGSATQAELDRATRELDTARARLAEANDQLALAREGTRPEEIAEARAALAEAEQALALVEHGFRSEEIDAAQARAAAAAAAVESIRRQLEELTIRAPGAAVVEAIDLRPGDLVAANAPVISLMDPGTLWVRAYVPEDRLDVSLGQEVELRVDAFPERRFAGRVVFVSRIAEFTPSNVQTPEERSKQVFRIKVEVVEGREGLRAGMAADVFLEKGE